MVAGRKRNIKRDIRRSIAGRPAIRIVIAEDQALVRRGAALLLSMEPDMEVVGQARNGVEAVELAQLLRPDVVLMDLHMPLKGGVAATREITRELPGYPDSGADHAR